MYEIIKYKNLLCTLNYLLILTFMKRQCCAKIAEQDYATLHITYYIKIWEYFKPRQTNSHLDLFLGPPK